MASILSVALICACVLVCSGAVYDQYPYQGQKSDVYPGGSYPGYPYQDKYGGYYGRYRRSVPSYDDGSYPSYYPYYPKGYPYYPKYPTQKKY